MIERMKRGAAMILAACMLAVMLPAQTVYAANAKLAFSDPSATVGGQVNVNMKVTSTSGENLSSVDVTITYDANALEFVSGTDAEGGSGKVRIHGDGGTPNTGSMTFSLKFNALAAGTTKIEVSNQEIYDSNSQLVTLDKQGSSTVTVGALATASKDATLKSLQISPGSLTPEFSPDVDSYAVTVGMDVDKIIVSAEANDENAINVIKGNDGLQMGENRVTCLVTAQDGETTKEYVIVVTKAEGGATADEGNTGVQVKLSAAARSITIMEPDENTKLPDGFVETQVKIDGHTVKGWVWSSDKDRKYCVVYGMNEVGEKNFYRYDLDPNEKTIQRYFQDPAADTGVTPEKYETLAADYNNLLKDYNGRMIVIVVLAVVAVILLILFIWQIISKDKKGGPDHEPGSPRGAKRRKEAIEADPEPEDEYGEEDYGEEDGPVYEEENDVYDEEAITREEACDAADLEADGEETPALHYEPLRRQTRTREGAQRPQRRPGGSAEGSPARGELEERPARGGDGNRPARGADEGRPVRPVRSGAEERPASTAHAEERPVRGVAEERPVRGAAAERPVRGTVEERPSRNAPADRPVRATAAKEQPSRQPQADAVRRSRPEAADERPVRPAVRPAAGERPARSAAPSAAGDYPVRQPHPAAQARPAARPVDDDDDFDLVDIE